MNASPKHPTSVLGRAGAAVPPYTWFGVSALFHYLGPAFAVLLFPAIGVLGIAWYRIASAAAAFAPFTHPIDTMRNVDSCTRRLLIALGACLAVMNCSFYLALERLPMSLVAAMEFIGAISVALYGLRTRRNLFALILAVSGVFVLINVQGSRDLIGLLWAIMNAVLFALYILLAHRISDLGASDGVARLGSAMFVAFLLVTPIGLSEAAQSFASPAIMLAGIGVGVSSSVIPYVCDQMVLSRLPRETFALMLSILPAVATVIAAIALAQIPSVVDILGITLVMAGIALHTPPQQ